jgi:hypothetical protein
MDFNILSEMVSPFILVIVVALTALFIFINIRRTLREFEQRKRSSNVQKRPYRMGVIVIKTLLFSVFYGIGIVSVVSGNRTSLSGFIDSYTASYCMEMIASTGNADCNKNIVALGMIAQSAFVFNLGAIFWNIFYAIYLFVCYFYFNLQLGFATLIVLFSSGYLSSHGYSFFMAFILVSCAISLAVLFYKFKRRLLNAIRYFFSKYGRSKFAKFIEFYVISLPYFMFSLTLASLNVEYCNILIQLLLVHAFSYFTLFKLYREGCDIGFDYDPW